MRRLTVPSFAKINWILEILGKRQDGFHELQTVYQTVDLSDEIVFELCSEPVIQLEVAGRTVVGNEANLLCRAASLLRKAAGIKAGVRIHLEKRIPIGAGLGGGSSNAAMALLALSRLWQCAVPLPSLLGLAAQLGSDVPFFLIGGTALGTGRGEKIEPLDDPFEAVDILLFYPGFQISSQAAYGLRDWGNHRQDEHLTKKASDSTIQRLHRVPEARREEWAFLKNDFQDVVFGHYPALVEARDSLQRLGCDRVMLCGSGSVLLGLGKIEQVKESVDSGDGLGDGEFFFRRTLSRDHYRIALREAGLLLP